MYSSQEAKPIYWATLLSPSELVVGNYKPKPIHTSHKYYYSILYTSTSIYQGLNNEWGNPIRLPLTLCLSTLALFISLSLQSLSVSLSQSLYISYISLCVEKLWNRGKADTHTREVFNVSTHRLLFSLLFLLKYIYSDKINTPACIFLTIITIRYTYIYNLSVCSVSLVILVKITSF